MTGSGANLVKEAIPSYGCWLRNFLWNLGKYDMNCMNSVRIDASSLLSVDPLGKEKGWQVGGKGTTDKGEVGKLARAASRVKPCTVQVLQMFVKFPRNMRMRQFNLG